MTEEEINRMTWNYRVMRRRGKNGEMDFGIHEVYYSNSGEVKGYTENSLIPPCQSVEDLRYELEIMLKAIDKEVVDCKE